MSKPLKKLDRPPLLHKSVQESIRSHISENNMRAGDPLPPETELAQSLGVSRNSVREAIKGLESMGILETRRGSGMFVRAFSLEPLLESLPYGLMQDLRELSELLDLRCVLETGMIGDVVHSLHQEQVTALQDNLARMRALAEQGKGFPDEDREFHRLLFLSMNNGVLLKLLDIFWLVLRKAEDPLDLKDTDPMRTYRNHVAIVEAVSARDTSGARLALEHHYEGIRERLGRVRNDQVTA